MAEVKGKLICTKLEPGKAFFDFDEDVKQGEGSKIFSKGSVILAIDTKDDEVIPEYFSGKFSFVVDFKDPRIEERKALRAERKAEEKKK